MNKALLSLLEEKPFEYITVSEVCKEAAVSRSTFYLHYQNTTDLLSETMKQLIDGFLSYFPVDTDRITNKFSDCSLGDLNYITAEYLTPYLSYIRDHRAVFTTALSQAHIFGFEDIFQRMYDNIFDPILARFCYPLEDRKYVMRFYLNGIHAIVLQWLKDGCDRSIEEVSQILHNCVFGLSIK